MEIVLTSDLSELGRLAEAVEDFGRRHELPEPPLQQMGLALDELVTNVISYGYGDAPGAIVVRLGFDGDWLDAELIDDAPAFDPFTAPPPDLDSPLEDRRVGGLGVHFVRTLLDRFAYAREGGQNRVRLGKRIGVREPTA